MSKFFAALKHGAIRLWPLAVAAAAAVAASQSFRDYVGHHPQVATIVPVVMWLLHAASAAKNPPAAKP